MISAYENCSWNYITVRSTDGTGFGMDYPLNSTITNCLAIGCGKTARVDHAGASGFGIGTGKYNNESITISNCQAIGNRKYGFFFEHQNMWFDEPKATRSNGFKVINCYAKNNLYDFGTNKGYDVTFTNCIANANISNENPLNSKNSRLFSFSKDSRRIKLEGCTANMQFIDSPDSSHYYYRPVYWALNNGLMDGGFEGTATQCRAFDTATRAQAIVFLHRFAGRPGEVMQRGQTTPLLFDDIAQDYYTDASYWLRTSNIYTAQSLYPGNACTRGDFINMLYQYYKKVETKKSNFSYNPNACKFPDVTANYLEAVNWGITNGIISSIEWQKTFKQNDAITRGEILTFLYRYNECREKTITIKPTPSPSPSPSTKPSPTPTPSTKPSTKPSPTPTPSTKPSTSPSPTPTPSTKPSTKPSPTPKPSTKPSTSPSPTPTPDTDKNKVPDQVTITSIDLMDNNRILTTWKAVPGAVKYRLINTVGNKVYSYITANNYQTEGIIPVKGKGTQTIKICAINSNGVCGEYSEEKTIIISDNSSTPSPTSTPSTKPSTSSSPTSTPSAKSSTTPKSTSTPSDKPSTTPSPTLSTKSGQVTIRGIELIDNNHILTTWKAVPGAVKYRLINIVGNKMYSYITANNYQTTGVIPIKSRGTQTIKVCAIDSNGVCGDYSEIKTITIPNK